MPLDPGVHALATEPADAPCPRAERLRAALETMFAAGADPEGLLDTLMVEDGPALFLRGDIYGTSASTLVAISADGRVKMIERSYDKGGSPAGKTPLEFRAGSETSPPRQGGGGEEES